MKYNHNSFWWYNPPPKKMTGMSCLAALSIIVATSCVPIKIKLINYIKILNSY